MAAGDLSRATLLTKSVCLKVNSLFIAPQKLEAYPQISAWFNSQNYGLVGATFS